MSEHKYYCRNCDAEIKSTDTTCSKCGKNLSEVGRRIEVVFTEAIGVSSSFEVRLTKKQKSIIEKVYEKIKNELAKKEIDSITINFGVVSFTIKNKKEK
jgi:predicted amidophosphoribosyltransferase